MRIRGFGILCAVMVGGAVLATPVQAAKFDGNWSMVAVTTKGHCGAIYIGLNIKRGTMRATGGFFAFYPITMRGRVSRRGYVSGMKAIAGPRVAQGRGRFGKSQATGTWKGRGPSGLCSGTWRANRL